MKQQASKLSIMRQSGVSQVEAQRASIIDIAERLFLQKGIENTSMSDIAAGAKITRTSLYRYFSDRNPIAFEVAARMLKRVIRVSITGEDDDILKTIKNTIFGMIDQFDAERDAYRYLGMFDQLYAPVYPNETLGAWYSEQLKAIGWADLFFLESVGAIDLSQISMVSNTTMSYLQKLASRGEVMSKEHQVQISAELKSFREMISSFFDHVFLFKNKEILKETLRSRR